METITAFSLRSVEKTPEARVHARHGVFISFKAAKAEANRRKLEIEDDSYTLKIVPVEVHLPVQVIPGGRVCALVPLSDGFGD